MSMKMIIKDMFEKPINRNINGVIKVSEKDEESIYQELSEYVVTHELVKHFRTFFNNYASTISQPTSNIGVWISGFFGSGKSHFLKILSYLLDSNLNIKDKKPIEYFEDGKIDDQLIIADMKKSASVSTDVMLFNMESKSYSRKDKDAIVKIFQRVFNSLRGYCDNQYFSIADLERKLDEQGKYEEFKTEFKNITQNTWEDQRDDFYLISDDIVETLVNIEFLSEEGARNWVDKAEDNYEVSIEELTKQINNYCQQKGNNHHVIFLVDEVGQYIGENTQLMLSLQTLVEDLGTNCQGKAWVVVTSQQDIDSIVRNVPQDFSKIQGRFKTRLNLTSSDVHEVIRRRILEKNENATDSLKSKYANIKYPLKNLLTFDNTAEVKLYKDAEDFKEAYPFIPYQFYLLQQVLTSVREHSNTGKHLAEGERSMLGLFQEAAIHHMTEDDNTLIPFYTFYDTLESFIDHDKSTVIKQAYTNENLDEFDVKILKTLLMLKHVDRIESNITNITTLIINNMEEDRINLTKKVERSLKKLYNETLIGKNGNKFTFLTNEEQETNRAIRNEQVDPNEIREQIRERIYDGIITESKYKYDKTHDIDYNKSIDNDTHGNKDMGLRIITPLYDFTTLDENYQIDNTLRDISQKEHEAILYFKDDLLTEDIRNNLQITKYLNKNSTELSETVKETKNNEMKEQNKIIDIHIEESIKTAKIYINGYPEKIEEQNSKHRLNKALEILCNKIYTQISYMDFNPEKKDIKKLLDDKTTQTEFVDKKYNIILNDIEEYLDIHKNLHKTVTLNDIIKKYSKAPYGYNELEIQWLIIKLYTQKRINITKGTEDYNDYNNNQKLDIITQKKYYDNLIIEKKKQTTDREYNILKTILDEIQETSVLKEKIPNTLHEVLKDIYQQILDTRKYYSSNIRYPGKEIIEDSYDLFYEINKIEKEENFITYAVQNEDKILYYYKNLGHVFGFFKNQKETFDKAIKTTQIYEKNQYYLTEYTQLTEYIDQINEILNKKEPYHFIPELPELYGKFNTEYDKITQELKKETIKQLIQYQDNIIEKLYNEDLKNKYESKIINEYNGLKIRIENSTNIAEIKDTEPISNIYQKYNTIIKQYRPPTPPEPIPTHEEGEEKTTETYTTPIEPESVPTKPAKKITISTLNLEREIEMDNEVDIEEFLQKLKEELRKQLELNDKIKLKL